MIFECWLRREMPAAVAMLQRRPEVAREVVAAGATSETRSASARRTSRPPVLVIGFSGQSTSCDSALADRSAGHFNHTVRSPTFHQQHGHYPTLPDTAELAAGMP